MLMIMPCTFSSAQIADRCAGLEHHPQRLYIVSCATHREARSGGADIGAVKAGTYTLAHVHWLRRASVRATGAHFRTEHGMTRSGCQHLVEVGAHVGVKRDHLVNRHGSSIPLLAAGFPALSGGSGPLLRALASAAFVATLARAFVALGLATT